MANYDDGSEYRTQNKITTLEDYNNGLIELTKISKRSKQQKIEVMSQISLLNGQVTDGSLHPTKPKDYDKSEFSKAFALTCSICMIGDR
ncbi:unnamed protein product [Rhizophagus irregularis]|nr:unnamed protein product [Rhizophagus irregularis]CAB4393655.1 unnamed protein product [Rhizophagus irregularis]CAB4393849.1 unnamed protein product [Rhizophagus irregularis]CAB4396869.1 unnamed protein product [Rhizophagus irregularis]CAB4398168.1 unnamed protein product [Rhizophagus irregularis]